MFQYLPIEIEFHFQVAGAEHKVTADDSARRAAILGLRRSELDDADAHGDGTPLVGLVFHVVTDVDTQRVLDSAGFARLLAARLQSHRRWRVLRQLERERHRVRAQFLQQTILQRNTFATLLRFNFDPIESYLHFSEIFLLGCGDLTGSHEQVLLELHAHDFILFASVTEGTHDLAEHASATQVFRIHNGHSIYRQTLIRAVVYWRLLQETK